MIIDSFMVCDDIRQEIGNKLTLVGLYDEQINFNVAPDSKNSWPKQMKLGLYVVIDLKDSEPKSFNFSMKYNGVKLEIGKGQITIAHNKELGKNKLKLSFVNNNFQFIEPGIIDFIFDFYDDKKNLIHSLIPNYQLSVREVVRD